jgi:hypothetical protein
MTRRSVAIGYGIIVLWMFLPFIPVIIASLIASACGCDLDEGSAHPCIVFGKDIGRTLYAMGVMGWLGLLTFPTGFLALLGFTAEMMKRRN